MLTTDELVAVVAGSLGGLIVFLLVLALIIYCIMGRRKKKEKDKKHFRHHQLTPNTDSSQSKHSTMSHLDPRLDPRMADPRMSDPRLPKVGSNPLWFGTPSMYSSGPSTAYQGVRRPASVMANPVGPKRFGKPLPGIASSAQGPVGHPVYQGGRIYHSQPYGVAYEPTYPLPRSGSYMDLYAYPYGYEPDVNNSRAMLIEYPESQEYFIDPYLEREVRRTGKRIKRSQSDATLHSTRRPKKKGQRNESPFIKDGQRRGPDTSSRDSRDSRSRDYKARDSSSRDSRDSRNRDNPTTVAQVHQNRSNSKGPDGHHRISQSEKVDNRSVEYTMEHTGISQSATDSAKLRAIERSKEKELHDNSREKVLRGEINKGFFDSSETESDGFHVRHYNYQGQLSRYQNPIVSKMDEIAGDSSKSAIQQKNPKHSTKDDFGSQESFHAEVSRKLVEIKSSQEKLDVVDGDNEDANRHARASRQSSARDRKSVGEPEDGRKVASAAFEFLDTYLTDDEGTEYLGSGNITPPYPARDSDLHL